MGALQVTLVVLTLGLQSVIGGTAAPAIYDLTRDYSTTANPNGVWSYGWQSTLGGPLSLFSRHGFEAEDPGGGSFDYWLRPAGGAPAVYHNNSSNAVQREGQGIFAPGAVWIGPGHEGASENFCVIRLTIPEGGHGAYELNSEVQPLMKEAVTGDCDFHVLKNGSEIFKAEVAPGAGTNFSQKLDLAVGDTIDFAIGRGADGREYASARKIEAALTQSALFASSIPRNWPAWVPWLIAGGCLLLFLIAIGALLMVIVWRRRSSTATPGRGLV
jgi:hypothetical protein